jgi:uncharacterized membrane protein
MRLLRHSRSKSYFIFAVLLAVGFLIVQSEFDMESSKEEAVSDLSDNKNSNMYQGVDYDGSRIAVGYIVMGHESRSFVECGASDADALWIVDPTNLVAPLYATFSIGKEPYSKAFVSIFLRQEAALKEGFGADYVGSGVVTGINYWPTEGFSCDYPWSSFGFRAFGNEPFWMLDITKGQATITRPGIETRTWDVKSVTEPFVSKDGSLEIKRELGACVDGMSGTTFGTIISIKADGKLLKGCGMIGLEAER